MSYCVNCGVELADSEKFCPLCDTEVINPRVPWKEPSTRPYPQAVDTIMRHVDRRYVATLMSFILVIPVVVTMLCDLLAGGGFSWSVYVIGAAIVLAAWVILPLYFKSYHRITFMTVGCLATILYLLGIELITEENWFLPLGLPISGAASVLILSLAYMFRQGRGRLMLVRASMSLTAVGIFVVIVEIVLDYYIDSRLFLSWSPYALTPCLVLAAASLIVEKRKNLKEEIRKRLFY